MEIHGSNSNEICYNVKKDTRVIEDEDTDTDTEILTAGTTTCFHNVNPRIKSKEKKPDIGELGNFINNKTDSFHKKNSRHNNFHIYHYLNSQQKE